MAWRRFNRRACAGDEPTHEVANIVYRVGDSFLANLDAATVSKTKLCGLVRLRLWWL